MAKQFNDPRGRHVRIYVDLLDSPAWAVLPWSTRALFIDLRATLGKANNGDISATLVALRKRGWSSPSTLATALYELRALGFLVQTRAGGVESGSKVCALYRFTDVDMFELPKVGLPYTKASHEYRAHKTIAEAELAMSAGVAQLRTGAIAKKERAAANREKTTLQKLERDASESVAIPPPDATEFGADDRPSLQIPEQKERRANRAAARVE